MGLCLALGRLLQHLPMTEETEGGPNQAKPSRGNLGSASWHTTDGGVVRVSALVFICSRRGPLEGMGPSNSMVRVSTKTLSR